MSTATTSPATLPGATASIPSASPTALSQRLGRDLWTVGSATLVTHAIAVATSVSLRWLLDPAQLGIWQSLRVFLSYGNYLNLGASKGAARELSVAIGRGDLTRVARDLDLAHTVNTLSSLVYAVALMGASIWCAAMETGLFNLAWSWGLAALAILVVVQRHVTFHITLLRAEQRFGVTARQSVYEAIGTLALGATATWCWGLAGLYAATLVVALGSLVYLRRQVTHPLRLAWSWSEIGRLIGIGGPILLTGLCTTLFRSLDRLTLLTFSPTAEFDVGCYSTALLAASQLYGLANMTGTVTSPKLAQLFGASQDIRAVSRFAATTTLWQSVWLTPVAAAGIVVGPALLGRLFPNYEAGLVALPWSIIGTLLLAIALAASNALIATERERLALRILAISTVLSALLLVAAGRWMPTIAGIAMATCLGQACYALSVAWFGIWQPLERRKRWSSFLFHTLAIVPALSAAILVANFRPDELHWLPLKSIAVGLVWAVSAGVIHLCQRTMPAEATPS